MKIKKCYVVLLALGGFIGYKWYQHYQWQQLMLSGYCEKDGTYFDDRHTDQELIDKAILYVLEHQPKSVHYLATDERWEVKRYTTMEELKKINPDCCRVHSWPADAVPEDYDMLVEGKAYRYVTINYKEYYLDNHKYDNMTKSIAFDNCGGFKDAVYLY